MFGGPPMQPMPQFMTVMPAPQPVAPPRFLPPPPPAAFPAPGQRPALPPQPINSAAALPKPIFRAQSAEENSPPVPPTSPGASLTLPPPEQLGVRPVQTMLAAEPGSVDWNAARAKFHSLGAVGFHLTKLASGSYRVSYTLPTADPDRTHLIEVVADTETAALALALQRAEQWAQR